MADRMLHPSSNQFLIMVSLITFSVELTVADCNTTIVADGASFRSPNHPEKYPDEMTCWYRIIGPVASVVTLTFDALDVEKGTGWSCNYDTLTIDDGDSTRTRLITTLCGHDIPPPIPSTGNAMFLLFQSDRSITETGFSARVDFTNVHHSATTEWPTGRASRLRHPVTTRQHSITAERERTPGQHQITTGQDTTRVQLPRSTTEQHVTRLRHMVTTEQDTTGVQQIATTGQQTTQEHHPVTMEQDTTRVQLLVTTEQDIRRVQHAIATMRGSTDVVTPTVTGHATTDDTIIILGKAGEDIKSKNNHAGVVSTRILMISLGLNALVVIFVFALCVVNRRKQRITLLRGAAGSIMSFSALRGAVPPNPKPLDFDKPVSHETGCNVVLQNVVALPPIMPNKGLPRNGSNDQGHRGKNLTGTRYCTNSPSEKDHFECGMYRPSSLSHGLRFDQHGCVMYRRSNLPSVHGGSTCRPDWPNSHPPTDDHSSDQEIEDEVFLRSDEIGDGCDREWNVGTFFEKSSEYTQTIHSSSPGGGRPRRETDCHDIQSDIDGAADEALGNASGYLRITSSEATSSLFEGSSCSASSHDDVCDDSTWAETGNIESLYYEDAIYEELA